MHRKWIVTAMGLCLTVGLSGCFGGSSSSDDSSSSTDTAVSLTEEEQVLGAALMGAQQANSAQGFAEGSATMQDDPTEETDTASLSAQFTPDSSGDVELLFRCDEGDGDFSGSGAVRMEESEGGNELIVRDSINMPSAFSGGFPDFGTAEDFLGRSNCVLLENGEEIYRYEGHFDIAQEENIDGQIDARAVAVQMGGYNGPGTDAAFDSDRYVRVSFAMDGQHVESRVRGEIYSCEGCLGGDLANFGHDPVRNTTSVSFMEMEVDWDGLRAEYQVGASFEDMFEMQTWEAGDGTGDTKVALNGLLKYSDQDTGCGFDVTYVTQESTPLIIENYETDFPSTVGGALQVTSNESNETYNVTYQDDGSVRIEDGAGNEVTPEPSEDAMSCGFFVAGDGAGQAPGTGDLVGEWRSQCRTNAGESAREVLAFESDGTGSRTLTSYSNLTCEGSAEDTLVIDFDFSVGYGVPATEDIAASELNLFNQEVVQGDAPEGFPEVVLDIFGIDNAMLYLGDRSGGGGAEDRPDELDLSEPYSVN